MPDKREKAVLIIDKQFVIGTEFTYGLRDRGFEVLYRNSMEEAKKIVQVQKADLIIAESSCVGELLDNEELSQRKGGIFLLNQDLKLLGFFDRNVFTNELAVFLSDYLKALSQ